MSQRVVWIVVSAFAAIALVGWLFVGMFWDREWDEPHVFLKYRPTFQVMFRAPGGEADPSAIPGHEGYLTPEDELEEAAYIDFVEVHGGYRHSIAWPLFH
jgi:hypothetical protein